MQCGGIGSVTLYARAKTLSLSLCDPYIVKIKLKIPMHTSQFRIKICKNLTLTSEAMEDRNSCITLETLCNLLFRQLQIFHNVMN